MSTPEQPLTRRQLKEMRRTGALPVVDPEKAQAPAEQPAPVGASAAGSAESRLAGLPKAAPVVPAPAAEERPEAAPQPARDEKPAEPVRDEKPAREAAPKPVPSPAPAAAPVAPTPPLTRRQARQLRTNEIAVTEAPGEAPAAPSEPKAESAAPARDAAPEPPKPAETAMRLPAGFTDAMSTPAADAREDEPEDRPKVGASFGAAVFQQAEERQRQERERAEREAQQRREATATATATPAQPQVKGELFAEAFQRSLDAGGSTTATGTSLVLHDMPGTASLSAPMTATGEFMITSSHVLPAGLASRGAAAGTTDGKDVDATLMDGEIPLHSSPTPIAASSAVSTSKAPGDVIRPPQPDKNHGLMLTLGIVAGVLGVGLAGVLIYAFATGVFD